MVVQRGAMPDPGGAADLAEFIGLLGELRAWAGMPSYRALAKKAGTVMRPPRVVSPFTVVDVFKPGRRRLDVDLVMAIVRALGADEPTVGLWRAACLTAHGLAKTGGPAGVLCQLPTDLATFTGRREELAHLLAAATRPCDGGGARTVVVSAIEGMAGVGKTRLAVHAAHQLVRAGHFTDVQLYVNLRGFDAELPPADPSTVLEAFLRQLGVPARHIPAARDERAAMYRDRLRDRDALVLLDNAADEQQLRDLIPAGPGCLVLITSRRSLVTLDGAAPHQLDVFTEADSLALLARIAGHERVAAEPKAAARIAEYCGHLPLAVSLAAARLRSRPTWTLRHLSDKLQAGRLAALRSGDRALRQAFHLSYQELDEPLRRIFRLLSHHPGPDTTPGQVAALADIPAEEAEDALEELQDEHLVTQPTPGRYELHDLLCMLAVELDDASPEPEPGAPLARLLDYFEAAARRADQLLAHQRTPFPDAPRPAAADLPDRGAALSWMRLECENMLTLARVARDLQPRRCLSLALAMSSFLQQDGPLPRGIALQRDMVALARERGEALTTANALWCLGRLYYVNNEYPRAVEPLREAVAAYRRIGERRGEANALLDLGRTTQFTAGLRRSAEFYEQARPLYRALGEHGSESHVLHDLARVRYLSGDRHAALGLQQEALDGYRRAANPLGEANALVGLARIRQADDRLPLAAELFEQAFRVYREIGNPLGQANALAGVARVRHRLGHRDSAMELYESVLKRYRDIGARQGEANTLYDLGRVRQDLGDPDSATDLYRQAKDLFDQLGDPHGAAQALNSTGTLLTGTGDPRAALPLHRQALDLARRADTPAEVARAEEGIARALDLTGPPASPAGQRLSPGAGEPPGRPRTAGPLRRLRRTRGRSAHRSTRRRQAAAASCRASRPARPARG
ncbi:tetratricopeptide repeat protein [Streptomyces sp. PTM05]|uniref:Tetratricopeptide repeat protein n=1 Tax=Streptantibioticus parmotrematis TaxID=2873249 RepID=A0ABS7QS67_9ACTN|nr:tetratricopeptide repeat protein [Streptantibioticus parmotrematis]